MVYDYQYKEGIIDMPAKLSIMANKIHSIPNSTNAGIINQFFNYMKNRGAS
jgi:hypothetical protein